MKRRSFLTCLSLVPLALLRGTSAAWAAAKAAIFVPFQGVRSLIGGTDEGLRRDDTLLLGMRDLAMKATNGTISTQERAWLDMRFQTSIQKVDQVGATTNWHGVTLLDGSNTFDLEGPSSPPQLTFFAPPAVNSVTLGLIVTNFDLTTVTNAAGTIVPIDQALFLVHQHRHNLVATFDTVLQS